MPNYDALEHKNVRIFTDDNYLYCALIHALEGYKSVERGQYESIMMDDVNIVDSRYLKSNYKIMSLFFRWEFTENNLILLDFKSEYLPDFVRRFCMRLSVGLNEAFHLLNITINKKTDHGYSKINYGYSRLTDKEREVLKHLLNGLAVSDVSVLSNRSVKTIYTQKISALNKLGCKSINCLYINAGRGAL